jgi:hypothetical protein
MTIVMPGVSNLPLYRVLLLGKIEEAIKSGWGFKRCISKKRIRDLVKGLN